MTLHDTEFSNAMRLYTLLQEIDRATAGKLCALLTITGHEPMTECHLCHALRFTHLEKCPAERAGHQLRA